MPESTTDTSVSYAEVGYSSVVSNFDTGYGVWDNPTMSISRVDSKKRVVLPNGRPGDMYDVQQQDDDRVMLVRVAVPGPARRMSRKACLEAMKEAPLRPIMPWEELRKLTREP